MNTSGDNAVPKAGDERQPPRRALLRWLTGSFLSLWGLGAAGVGMSFLRSPDTARRPESRIVRCGPLSSLPIGSARFVRHGTDPILVVRVAEAEVVALSAVCTHLRCILVWDGPGRKIRCPCHDGLFDHNGNVLSGPPPRPLRRFRAGIRAGEILVYREGAR